MSLAQRLAEHVAAAFTGLWVQSCEHEDALAEIARLCRDRKWSSAVWDIDRGLRTAGNTAVDPVPTASGGTDPLAAIRAINSLAPGKNQPEGSALLVLPNFHRFSPIRRDRAGLGPPDPRRQTEPHVHRDSLARCAGSGGAGENTSW